MVRWLVDERQWNWCQTEYQVSTCHHFSKFALISFSLLIKLHDRHLAVTIFEKLLLSGMI